jgi:hypothetical protein
MTDHKFTDEEIIFTDEEIIKALECCNTPGSCSECPYYCINEVEYDDSCAWKLIEDILPLINDQKAEIERLKSENKLLTENDVRNKYPNCVSVQKGRIYTRTLEDYDELIGDISAEAIEAFAERLKSDLGRIPQHQFTRSQIEWSINTFVKEMTEENK